MEEIKEYLEPDNNVSRTKSGINVDFVYNYETLDAEKYGLETINKLSGIISQNIYLRFESANNFSFEVKTNQLND